MHKLASVRRQNFICIYFGAMNFDLLKKVLNYEVSNHLTKTISHMDSVRSLHLGKSLTLPGDISLRNTIFLNGIHFLYQVMKLEDWIFVFPMKPPTLQFTGNRRSKYILINKRVICSVNLLYLESHHNFLHTIYLPINFILQLRYW